MCFNEIHLDETDVLSPQMFGFDNTYSLYRCDRGSNGGGVSVIVDKKLQPQVQKGFKYCRGYCSSCGEK